MIRWKNLAPRIALIATLPLALYFLTNPMLRHWVKHQCQSITGAKVEVGSVRASLLRGTLQISDFRLADPGDPMTNLIQADTALVTLNPAWFWRREFVVEHGVVRNLQFDTPRTTTGPVGKRQSSSQPEIQWFPREFALEQARLHQRFAEHLQIPEFAPHDPSFKLLRVSEELRSRWPFAGYEQKRVAEMLQNRLEHLASRLEESSGNPLRDADRIPPLVEHLRSIESELAQTKESLSQLHGQLAADRQSLHEAKKADALSIGRRAARRYGEVQTLAQILVGPNQTDRIEDALRWIRWFRSATLDPEKDFRPTVGRGVDLQLLCESRPTFWIRSLELDGRGRFAGQSFPLVGSVRNLALQPRLLPNPCVIELRTPGSALAIHGELDRREQDKLDHITLECANLQMPAHSLGNKQGLLVEVGPSRLAAHVDVRIRGNTIDGLITLQNSDTTMRMLESQSPLVSRDLTHALDRELGTIRVISTEIRLRGELSNIQIEVASDLGPKLGLVASQVGQKLAETAKQEHLMELDNLYKSELALLNQVSQRRLDELAELLEAGATRVAEFDRLVPSSNGLNRIR